MSENEQPVGTEAPFVAESINFLEDWSNDRLILIDYLIKAAFAINDREIAQYQDAVLDSSNNNISFTQTGQEWFGIDPQKPRDGSRTVVVMNALGNNLTQTKAHGIAVTSNTRFTRIFGTANAPGISALPLPYVDAVAVANNISIWVDATNVNIRYGANYVAYTEAFVVLEWVDNTA